jgi:hypothetical protein
VAEKAAAERIAKAALTTFAGEIDLTKTEVVPSGLYAKMANILTNIPDLKPEGKNAHFSYKFWSTDQITGYFRTVLGKAGIAFYVDVETYDMVEHATGKGGRSAVTNLLVRFTLVDSETGEQVSGRMLGQGDDPGDKGANKAIAAATKYWLLKTFLLGGEDPEADERTDEREERPSKPVKIGKSSIEGIQRGGRSNKATDVQVRQVAQLSVDLGWKDVAGIAKRLSEWLNDEVDLSDTPPEDQRDSLRKWLESLSGDDIATLINKMVELRDEPESDAVAEATYDQDIGAH